jgi:hypothetical protein
MAERLRNGRKRHGSAINKLLNRIAEAVGLGSSVSALCAGRKKIK